MPERPLNWYIVRYSWTGQDGIAFKDFYPVRTTSPGIARVMAETAARQAHLGAVKVRIIDVAKVKL